MGVNRKEA